MQEIPERVQSTINAINRELRGHSSVGRKKSAQTGSVARLAPNP